MKRQTRATIMAGLVVSVFIWIPVAHADFKTTGDTCLQNGDRQGAIANYQKAIAATPSHQEAYFNLAVTYYLDYDLKNAMANLEKLISLSPNDVEALYNLGCLKLYSGDLAMAWKYFRKAQGCHERSLPAGSYLTYFWLTPTGKER